MKNEKLIEKYFALIDRVDIDADVIRSYLGDLIREANFEYKEKYLELKAAVVKMRMLQQSFFDGNKGDLGNAKRVEREVDLLLQDNLFNQEEKI